MTARWHVVQAKRSCEVKASLVIVRSGFEAFLPVMQKQRRHNNQTETVSVPRFPTYLFARFDSVNDPWGLLTHDDGKRAGVVRVLCDGFGNPRPVPDRAMEAMRAYTELPAEVTAMPHAYREGQSVLVYTAGVAQQAVFLSAGKQRARVKLWILGAQRETEVALSALEPDEILTLTAEAP
jgi:hypothetical protein